MNRVKIIDAVASGGTNNIDVQSTLEYSTVPAVLINKTIPAYKNVLDAIAGATSTVLVISATAGDVNPLVISAAALIAAGINSLRPRVFATIPLPGTVDVETTEGITGPRIDYAYTDATKSVLTAIRVYGNDNSGTFNEDTTFVIY